MINIVDKPIGREVENFYKMLEIERFFDQEGELGLHDGILPEYGSIVWTKSIGEQKLKMVGEGYYTSLALFFIQCLGNFFLRFDDSSFSSFFYFQIYNSEYDQCLSIIRGHDNDFYVYFGLNISYEGNYLVPAIRTESGQFTIESWESYEEVLLNLKAIANKIAPESCTGDNVKCFSFTEKELITEILNFFKLAMSKLKNESRVWELNFIKEAVNDYKALKNYAQEQGWL